MLAVIIFIIGWFKSRNLLIVSLLVVFCAYFAVPRVQTRIAGATDPADSARFRFESWSNALQVSKENLLIGVGFNNFKAAQKDLGLLTPEQELSHSASGSDSSLLLILATTGIAGLLAYLAGLFQPVFMEKKLNVMVFALTAGLLVDSLFINSLFYPQIMFLLFSIHCFSRT
jgi:O-antigen ligase